MTGVRASGRKPLKAAFCATRSLVMPSTLANSLVTLVQSSPQTRAVISPPTFFAAVTVLRVIGDRASPL